MEIKVKKLVDSAVMPTKAHESDAGFDLTATSVGGDSYGNYVYGTGLALEIPQGFFGLVVPRSSIAKKRLLLSNSVGVIDSDYRGEIFLKMKGLYGCKQEYITGDRVGQLIILPVLDIKLKQSESLSETERGTGCFGSTGS